MKNIPIRFNKVDDIIKCFPQITDMLAKPYKHISIDYYVDSYYGSDDYGDGSPERPFKTARTAYEASTHIANNYDNIVLRGYFQIDFDDSNVCWIGDDKNTVIEYPNNDGKCGNYINLTVKGYKYKGTGSTLTFQTNLNSERDTNGGSTSKSRFGVIDLRKSKPASGEILGGYWYSVVLGNKFGGGNHYCIEKGLRINVNFSSDCLFTADSTFLVNDTEVSYLSERNNFESDSAYTEYIKSQTNFNNLFGNNARNIVLRYSFDEIFLYDEENLSISLTEIGEQLSKQYIEQFRWLKNNKIIPIIENSDGVKECFDTNTAKGGITVEDDCIVIDEFALNGQIMSKVIKLNRAKQAINGLISSLRHQMGHFSTTYEIGVTHSDAISIQDYTQAYTISAAEEGYYKTERIGGVETPYQFYYNEELVDFSNGEVIFLEENDIIRMKGERNMKFNLVPIVQPNVIASFYFRGTNVFKETLNNGTLIKDNVYLAINGNATININGNTRTLIEGESYNANGNETVIDGDLGLVFNDSDPWFIIESNSENFGVGLYNGASGYEKPYINGSVYRDIQDHDIYLTKSIKLPSNYDDSTTNGISFRYIQLKLKYSTQSMDM